MDQPLLSLYTAAQTRELDRLAIVQAGIDGYTLMNRAAACTFQHIMSSWPECRRFVVLCGIGNNGGDGYLIAKLAQSRGLQVQVYQLGDLQKQKGDALTARQAMLDTGIVIKLFNTDTVFEADVLVDAMLGTGLQRTVEGLWLSAIQAVNSTRANIVAVDIASGLHADTGCQLGQAVKANLTVTYIGRKQGLYTADGKACSGRVEFDDLDIPTELYQQVPSELSLLPQKLIGSLLKPRALNSHKGHHGHVLIVGGAPGMSGAVMMAASAALRSGCGLVSVATHPSHATSINQQQPEIMSHGINTESELQRLIEVADVIALGPGLGFLAWSETLYHCVMASDKPLVIDADGLNWLAKTPQQKNNWILTPHPGEAGRLLNCSAGEVQLNRYGAVKQLQKKYAGLCLLKGAGSLLSDGRQIVVCPAGNPGMASAGMGDVLSGIIASLVAQAMQSSLSFDVTLFDAASFGLNLHALAGDEAANTGGEKGLLASDLYPFIRRLINDN